MSHKQWKQTEYDPGAMSTGVFLVGLGLLFFSGWWWPGIMFVLAASAFAKANGARDRETREKEFKGAALFGLIGLAFAWDMWPLILIGLGVMMLMRNSDHPAVSQWRRRLDAFLENDTDELHTPAPRPQATPVTPSPVTLKKAPDPAGTAFDDLSDIYDPVRDAARPAGRSTPIEERPTGRPFPSIEDEAPNVTAERRLDNMRNGSA